MCIHSVVGTADNTQLPSDDAYNLVSGSKAGPPRRVSSVEIAS